MKQKYPKRTPRSRRKAPVTFRSRVIGRDGAQVQLALPIAEILAGVQDAVEAVAAEAGLLVMQTLIEEEVEHHAGPRYQRRPGALPESGLVVRTGRSLRHGGLHGKAFHRRNGRGGCREGFAAARWCRVHKGVAGGEIFPGLPLFSLRGGDRRNPETRHFQKPFKITAVWSGRLVSAIQQLSSRNGKPAFRPTCNFE